MAAGWAHATEELRRLEHDPARLLSIGLNLALSLPIALLIGVPTAGVGAGVLLGALVAALAYLRLRARERAHERRLEQVVADVRVDADDRVALVTKQYEWAVNDIANLRDALRRTETRALAAEKRLQMTPTGAGAAPLVTRGQSGDRPATLRFESDGPAPAQVRILEDADVVGISQRALESEPEESSAFVVSVSDRVAAGIASGDPRFMLEALVGEEWRRVPVRRTPSGQRDTVSDKRGRVYGAASDVAPRLAFSIAEE